MQETTRLGTNCPKRVLIVDDDEGLRNLIARRLGKVGFEVCVAADGASAVEMAAADSERVMVLDQKLSDMTGRQVVGQLSERGITIPFVMMTGQGDERLAVEMMKLGAADYLVKGLDLLDLLPATLERVFHSVETEKKLQLTETELRESREQYKALIEQAFEAVILIDPVNWQIIEVNRRFTEWFGYSLPEDAPLSRDAILVDIPVSQAAYDAKLFADGYLPVTRRIFRHKDGTLLFMERSAKIIHHQLRSLVVVIYRNIADQLQQEQERLQDAAIARRIQRAQLSCPPDSEYVAIETAYLPCGDISGDLYHLEWRNDGNLLRGYLVDVTGHGLTTALYTSTINMLLHEAAELDASLSEQVVWLNRQVARHFAASAFAAAIAFELDLQVRELRYVGAGITRFWVRMAAKKGMLQVPGRHLGVDQTTVYPVNSLPLAVDDHLCFATDGVEALLADRPICQACDGQQIAAMLLALPADIEKTHDTTAVCIRIKSLPQALFSEKWPKVLKLNGFDDYRRLKGEVAKVLAEVTGLQHSIQEVAVNEALANAMECRDGVPRQHRACVRFNIIGARLIVRVQTSRIGFAGNAMLRRLRSAPEELFAFGEDQAMGRGIPLMLSLSHRMMYNNEGTEVLLAWRMNHPPQPDEIDESGVWR